MAELTNYLGEVMIHKLSRKVGPIVLPPQLSAGHSGELTLKTHDGVYLHGSPSEFEIADQEQYFSFVDGWLSNIPVGMY